MELTKREKYDKLASVLEKNGYPCRIKLQLNSRSEYEICVETGRDCPEELDDNISDAAILCGFKHGELSLCAESSGYEVMDEQRIAGGPKKYFMGKIWKG